MNEILLLITDHYPFGKGEPFLETEIQFLSANFNQIYIISRNRSDFCRETPSNVNIISLKKFSLWSIFYSLRFTVSKNSFFELKTVKTGLDIIDIFKHIYRSSQLIRVLTHYCKLFSGKENIILYSYWLFYGALAVARIKNTFPGIKAFSRAHGYDLYLENRKNNYIPFRNYLIENLDHIYFISNHGKKYFINLFGHSKTQYKVSYLGSAEIVKKQNNNIDYFHIVTCSSVNKNKRIHLIAEALSGIQKHKIKWTHIGTGPLIENVKKITANLLKNKKNITYSFLGHLEHNEVIEFLKTKNIDCLINTSISEGLPFTIIEAFSAGIPVIAPNTGGINEIVNDRTGFLLSKNFKIQDLILSINKLINHPDKAKYLGSNAYKKWSEQFNSIKNYNNFIKLIKLKPPNIIYVYYGDLNEGEGPTSHVLGIVKSWIKLGYYIDLFVFNNYSSFQHPNVKITTIKRNLNPFRRTFDFRNEIFNQMKNKNYLFIYARMHFYLYFIRNLGLTSIFEANGIIELESRYIKEKYPLLANLERKIFLPLLFKSLRKANSIIVITRSMKKYFIENYQIDQKRIFISGNGTSIDNRLLEQNFPRDNSIIFVGNLRQWQGIDKIVEEIIKRKRNEIDIKIIGKGELFNKLNKLLLINRYNNIKLMGSKSFLNAFKEMKKSKIGIITLSPDLVNLIKGVDPLKLSNYWLAGLPVLASDIPDLNIVEEIGGGLNFQAGNYDDFFEKLDYMLSLREKDLAEMGEKGKKHVLENKTWDIIGENIFDFIQTNKIH